MQYFPAKAYVKQYGSHTVCRPSGFFFKFFILSHWEQAVRLWQACRKIIIIIKSRLVKLTWHSDLKVQNHWAKNGGIKKLQWLKMNQNHVVQAVESVWKDWPRMSSFRNSARHLSGHLHWIASIYACPYSFQKIILF